MHCLHCRSENPPSAKFCMECGHALAEVAPIHPRVRPNPQSYTPRFLIEKILTTRGSIEGERKFVTVLFADVANYTSIAEKLDPEEVHRIMDECFRILTDAIHRYEGTVNQFTGDGVMALFGAPVSHEDHAQQACLAALDIQEALARYSEHLQKTLKIDFQMRVGLNSGPVVVGSIGDDLRMDYSAIGDTTNLASRLERLAKPGRILLSENTYKAVNHSFSCRSLGKLSVKGKEEPVEAFRLEAKREVHRPRLGVERQIYADMVGRDRELDLLELQVMKLVGGEGSIVNIVGEAGIGKSRLVAELKKRNVMTKVTLLESRAISMGRNLSFHPIIHLLKSAAHIKEEDTEERALERLRSTVKGVCPDEADDLLPFVATMMGMKLSERDATRVRDIEGEALEKLILKSLRDILARMSEFTPLVIVTDDLHWADTSSIVLMESLFRLADSRRIVFVNAFRPGSLETGDRLIRTVKENLSARYVEILLQPLDDRMCEDLLTHVFNIRGLHRGLIAHILQRAGGNPYFVEEIVRSFIDQGAIVFRSGRYEVTGRIEEMAIPSTIHDVLMARIDRLDENSKNLLKIASVIGRNFFHRILSEVADPAESLDTSLSHLKEVQLIRERQRLGEVEYLFKHALAQEAAYESVLPHKRQELHLKAATAIERVFPERLHQFYGMLAYHYSRAKSMDEAEKYLILAGQEALKSSASFEAIHYYEEAMTLYLNKVGQQADPEKVAMLESNIAIALYNRGQYQEAVRYFEKALRHYRGSSPKNMIARACKALSAFLHFSTALYLPSLKFRRRPTQRDEEVFALFYKKCKALAPINPRRFFVESLHLYRDLTRFDLAGFPLGLEMFTASSVLFSFSAISFRFSRKILDSVKDEVSRGALRSVALYELLQTAHNYFSGDWMEIPEYRPDVADKDLALGNIYFASQYLYWQGLASLYRGFLDRARSIVQRLDDIALVYDNDFSLFLKQNLNTILLKESQEFDAALVEVEQGIKTARRAEFYLFLMDLYACQASIQASTGDISGAKSSLRKADEIRSDVEPTPVQLCEFHRSHAQYYLKRLSESILKADPRELGRYRNGASKSIRMLRKTTQRVAQHRTEAYRLKGTYCWLIKKDGKAFKWWRKSIQEGERLAARLELSLTYSEVGKRLLEDRNKKRTLNGIGAETYLEKARVLFDEMGLQQDLEELH